MIKFLFFCALSAFTSTSFALDVSSHEAPATGIENVASHDLSGDAWWAKSFDDDQVLAEPDPLEPMNRAFFNFNRVLDGILLKPMAIGYDTVFPHPVKEGVTNFLDNISAPLGAINYTLQGEGEKTLETIARFLINTTFGIFGLVDVAKEVGIPSKPATFNQTLATWGVETGPYLMVPFVGPSSFRGTYGMVADWYLNPLYYIAHNKHRQGNRYGQQVYLLYALYGLDVINRRSKLIDALNDIERNSLDPYVTIRNLYFQKQAEMEREIRARKTV
ncbi:MAG: VacJ family lipoprotein [Alphaproteobacteria bacterium]|nr:VacJ family lipoprotein [Alphaproteobacteria bacterium]